MGVVRFGVAAIAVFALPISILKAGNPWRDLNPSIRVLLSQHLGAHSRGASSIEGDWEFQKWYHQYYCSTPDQHSGFHCSRPASEVYPEFVYNSFSLDQRVASACLLWKISMDFQGQIPSELQTITSGDHLAEVDIEVSNAQTFQQKLRAIGYTSFFGASRSKIWGLRSPHTGPALHWYQDSPHQRNGTVSVHIDYHNPGCGAGPSIGAKFVDFYRTIDHAINDHCMWGDRTLGEMVQAMGGDACGLADVDLTSVINRTNGDLADELRQVQLHRFEREQAARH